jgi:hypothetical protein
VLTGKNRPSDLSAPPSSGIKSPPQTSQPMTVTEKQKLNVDTMSLSWQNDPFLLPKSVTDKKTEKQKNSTFI